MERREVVAIVAVLVPMVSGAVWLGRLSERVADLEEEGLPGATTAARRAVERTRDQAIEELAENRIPGAVIASYDGATAEPPPGWVICGTGNSPRLNDRFLVGTTDLDLVGKKVGAEEHTHGFDVHSTGEKNGEHRRGAANTDGDYADNIHKGVGETGPRNWYHEHQVEGNTSATSNVPPSVRVIFYCRSLGQ